MIGESPLSRGVPGEISKYDMKSLAGAFEKEIEIKQANGDMDEAFKNMASIPNNVVSSASTEDRKRDNLLNILIQETDINIRAKVEQPVEYQRNQWTNHGNINLWLDTWDKDLVEIGFSYRDYEEKIVISDDQLRIIINIDESWFYLYGREGRRGGRPSVQLFNRGLLNYGRSA